LCIFPPKYEVIFPPNYEVIFPPKYEVFSRQNMKLCFRQKFILYVGIVLATESLQAWLPGWRFTLLLGDTECNSAQEANPQINPYTVLINYRHQRKMSSKQTDL
jgi:hypothetical protein